MIIYKATSKIDGKIYIGQTKFTIEKRIKQHHRSSKQFFGCALRKHGLENFEFEIIETCSSKDDMNEREIYWISFFNCTSPNGYNLTHGGDGLNPTEEIREKMRVKGLEIQTPEMKERISNSLKKWYMDHDNPFKGKKHSVESIEKMKISQAGRKVSEETKNKISKALKGKSKPESFCEFQRNKKLSLETKLKISESHKGMKHTDETKKKISELKKGVKLPYETRQKIIASNTGKKRTQEQKDRIRASQKMKKVVCVETGIVYESVSCAQKAFNSKHISSVCSGKRKTTNGYHFKYL